MKAKKLGLHTIAVTSLAHSKNVSSRHSSGKKLYELVDIVLDTDTPFGDACMNFKGLSMKAGPASTVLGAAILNSIMVKAIQYILDKGETPPILMSANIDGSDEHNTRIVEHYGRLSLSMGLYSKTY